MIGMKVITHTKISSITFASTCPYCERTSIRRSLRRTFFERFILRMLLICPFRCMHCHRRFYKFSLKRFHGYTSAKSKENNDKQLKSE